MKVRSVFLCIFRLFGCFHVAPTWMLASTHAGAGIESSVWMYPRNLFPLAASLSLAFVQFKPSLALTSRAQSLRFRHKPLTHEGKTSRTLANPQLMRIFSALHNHHREKPPLPENSVDRIDAAKHQCSSKKRPGALQRQRPVRTCKWWYSPDRTRADCPALQYAPSKQIIVE